MSHSPAVAFKTFHIVVLPGDGIGLDVTEAAVRVLQAVETQLSGVSFEFKTYSAGAAEYVKNGDPLPGQVYDACLEFIVSAALC